MKKLLIIVGLILIPSFVSAITVPWNKVVPSQIYPPLVGDMVGIGTTTPMYQLTVSSTTAPQLSLSQGAGGLQWAFRAIGGNLYFSTTTVEGTATTSISALEIAGTGFGTTTVRGLNISGQASTTSNVGIVLTGGCIQVGSSCISGTVTSVAASGGTTGMSFTGSPITSSGTLTLTGTLGIANGGTNATSFSVSNGITYYDGTRLVNNSALTFDGTKLITTFASTTNLTSSGETWLATSGASVGIGTTSPYSMLSVAGQVVGRNFIATSTTATSTFASSVGIASSTPFSRLSVGAGGGTGGSIMASEHRPATSTTATISWTDGNQQLYRHGTQATTISFSNYTDGQTLRLVVCNPGGSAGAITWGTQVLWSGGTTPTQTTTANKCDVWSFIATGATSTLKILGAQSANF